MPWRLYVVGAVLLSTFAVKADLKISAADERAGVSVTEEHGQKLNSLLDGTATLTLTLEAPFQKLFANKRSDDDRVFVPGTLTYKDAKTGTDVVFREVQVSVRGHTSRNDAECTFPKLKLKAKPGGVLRIGTHCGELPDDRLTSKYGRLANEKSPLREGLTYRILDALGVPTLRTRPARITYVDPEAGGAPLVRAALLVEDDNDAMARVGGTRAISLDAFGNVKSRHAIDDGSRIAFGEAAIANFDWCLKFTPDDVYRCNDPKPLWNILAFERPNSSTALLMKDFDLAGTVVGHHPWFNTVFNGGFVPSRSETAVDVMAQVQRARSLLSRAELDALRRGFVERRDAAYRAVDGADVDEKGRAIARAHLDAFYDAISDAQFYRPVVARTDVQVYKDAARTEEACGPKDTLRVGTPVNTLQKSGEMSQVLLLDAMWRWGSKNPCQAVLNGPVWVETSAITSQFPAH
jgi:hypothetical protein